MCLGARRGASRIYKLWAILGNNAINSKQ
jgi:hypothetical protein